LGAGLLSFIIDGARTMLVAGTRSSGKTSLLSSLLLEIMPTHRIITIEDTLELPVADLRKMSYDILSMKVRSSLSGETSEVDATEGIRASLRLGDSSLIVGEIRSDEAKALYEAMRVGALANVVAGTIHGGSPYAVFDRVCNDLAVPITSFKATDLIIIANPIKTADGLKSVRRVLSISEVRKHWEKDPLKEGGFVDLMKYDVNKDILEPTDDLINGDSEIIKEIAGNVKGWAGNWDNVWDNIKLRQMVKEEIVNYSDKLKNKDLLEADFTIKSNNAFHQISNQVTDEIGIPKSDIVFPKWKAWLEKEAQKIS
jgi:archaeal flagellar protein FlaI